MRRFLLPSMALPILLALSCGGRPKPMAETTPKVPRIVDLTYSFDESTIYWPTNKSFQHEKVAYGKTAAGYWYSSFNYAASEHGGTHLDAPIHFAEGKHSVEQIPIEQHMGPGIKISVADKAAQDRDYRITAQDVQSWEARNGPIPRGAVVLIHTGWGRHWGQRARYLGSEKAGDASDLHFPGIARDAAELLAQRNVAMVGIDTASLDHGPSKDFIAHQVLNGADIAGLENVANLEQLPEKAFLVLALPLKIAGGSGAPCRIVALLY